MTAGDESEAGPQDFSWFDGAGLGVFVHWDHASQQGLEISWPLVGGVFSLPMGQAVSVDDYHASAGTFDPTAFDGPALARLAKAAGATYGVFTTKHHSGYTMWPSSVGGWGVANSPCDGRDLVREFADAFRAEGLRIGFYFSLSDWHHIDYPRFTEDHKPYQFGTSPPIGDDATWQRFLDDQQTQITELLTNYGQVDLVWFDGGWERPFWKWRGPELLAHMRSLQPRILINDRLPGLGDYTTPEQFIPAESPGGRWETCMTMNESWGFNPRDTRYKSPRAIVHAVAEVTGRGGNLLLNVSPMGDGSLPPEQIERMQVLAGWNAANSAAVHGTRAGLAPWQFYGPSTRTGDRTFLFLLSRPYDSVTVRGVPIRRVTKVTHLASGRELRFRIRCGLIDSLMPDPLGEVTIDVPAEIVDEYATVLTLDIS